MAALVEERQKQLAEREKALEAERSHAGTLAQQVDNLKDLIAKLEQGLNPATRELREAGRSDSRPALSAFRDPGRLAPAVAFASLRGRVPIPVNGVKLKEFGAPDASGGSEKGISIATRAGAQVTAPADSWVVYAGPFRSYGQLLILNVGGGYHVEGGLRQIVVFALAETLEAFDCVLDINKLAGRTGKHFGNVEWLRQETFDLASARDGQFVVFRQFVHAPAVKFASQGYLARPKAAL